MLMRLMSKGEYLIVPKGTKFTGAGKLGLKNQEMQNHTEDGCRIYPLLCLTRVWWPVYHPCPPMKFFHNNWVGWACRTEILFSSPLLNLHLKVFTKLHDSVSRIQNFPASDRVWGSNIPLKHLHARQKIWSLSVTKAIKIGGIWVPFFQPIWGLWVNSFQNLGQCGKKQDFGWQFFGKTRGFWLM